MPTINLGKVRTVWRGAYNNTTAYTMGDGVDINGNSYILKVASDTGTFPPNAPYWQLSAEKGDTGATGAASTVAGPAGPTGPAAATYAMVGSVLNITT
jgi:hypothetical protein